MLLVECEIEAKAKEQFSMPDLKPYLMYDKEQRTRVDEARSCRVYNIDAHKVCPMPPPFTTNCYGVPCEDYLLPAFAAVGW